MRNNSAWNHRWFVLFARHADPAVDSVKHAKGNIVKPEIIQREIEYAIAAIQLAPQNQSPWNYLRGIMKYQGKGLEKLKAFAEGFADVDKEDEVRSSHALDFLADVYADQNRIEQAGKALELLARRYDPIRKNYWNYRRELLGLEMAKV